MDDIVGRLQSSFPSRQLDVIIGSLLGDARLECRSKGIRALDVTARFRVHHGEKQEDQKAIIDFLNKRYSINPTLVKDRHQWKIAIGVYNYQKFIDTVAPHVSQSMIYKVVYPRNDFPLRAEEFAIRVAS